MPTAKAAKQDPAEPAAAARESGLRYVSDTMPGIRRVRRGKGTGYVDGDGRAIRDEAVLGRIRALAIPPAWTDVWISPSANGHLQATGRDARGRKQYRYHAKWRQSRDETKYSRMVDFGRALPRLRKRVRADLARRGTPREKVLATIVALLEATLIRVGNDEYARTNQSFGLTTMRDRHVEITGENLVFSFRGKGGKEHEVSIRDGRLARAVRQCRDVPGYELFQYIDGDGVRQSVDSGDVNDYLRAAMGDDFTAKDFRTWAGTVLAAMALQEFEKVDSEAQAKRNVVQAIERVAERLGNTPTICRKSYVHPAIVDSYLDGTMLDTLRTRARAELTRRLSRLEPEEAAVLVLLQQRLDHDAKATRRKAS